MDNEPVEVVFSVDQDENGYSSVTSERIWCSPLGGGRYVVDNVPFYARDISFGDEIEADGKDGALCFSRMLQRSLNTTVRVFARKSVFAPDLIPRLRAFGGMTEKMEGFDFVALLCGILVLIKPDPCNYLCHICIN